MSQREVIPVWDSYVISDVPVNVPPSAALEAPFRSDVSGSLDGLEHGFVVPVRNGRLATLEGYIYEEPWPREVRNFKLTYQQEPRDLGFS